MPASLFFRTLGYPGLLVAALGLSSPASAMTINLSWDSSVTTNPNAAQIEAAITKAAQAISSHYTNPITLNMGLM